MGECTPTGARGRCSPWTPSTLGSSMETAMEGGLRGFTSLPLGRGLSSPGGVGRPWAGVQLPGTGVPAAGCLPGCVVWLWTDAGSSSPGKRLPPIGYAAQLQLPEKIAHPSLPLCRAKLGWYVPGHTTFGRPVMEA